MGKTIITSVKLCNFCSYFLSRNSRMQHMFHPRAIIGVFPIHNTLKTSDFTQRSIHTTSGHYVGKEESATIDKEEVEKFSRIAQTWWDISGEVKALHTMNALRIPFVRDALVGLQRDGANRSPQPLKGFKVMDVGCGGGILAEPLARLGARVTGLDASLENILGAEAHAKQDPGLAEQIQYMCAAVEDIADVQEQEYDGLVASEILEHVADQPTFVAACCKLVKPGGSVFFTTLNKTWLSYALGVVAAERILRLVPPGAHDWNKFIPVSHLQNMLTQNGCKTEVVRGMTLNPVTLKWSWVPDTSINYAIHAVKSHDSNHVSSSSSESSDNE